MDENSMKDDITNNGIIDRLIDYTQQIYGAMKSKEITALPLEPQDPVSISGVSIRGYVKVEGHGDVATELDFFEQYKMIPAELLNVWLKGFIYVFSTPIGTTTISEMCPKQAFSRVDDLITSIIAFEKMFNGSKTGPLANSDVANKAYIGNQIMATEEVAKRVNPERAQTSLEFSHLQMLDYRKNMPDINTQKIEQLEEELKIRKPIRAILDSKYHFYTIENGKMVFSDPRDRILELISTQVDMSQRIEAIVGSRGDQIYGYFVEAFVIANMVDGKPDNKLSKQILPKEGFLNLASINDWKNILDIMDIFVTEEQKGLLTDRLLSSKELLDQMLTNFYIKIEKNYNQNTFKTDNGNVLIGTTLSFWAYMCIVSDFLYQITKEGNLNEYNPILIFGSSTTFEEFVQKNYAQLSLWIDSNTCAVLRPNVSIWSQLSQDKKSEILEKFVDDFNIFKDMLSQTDTQKAMDDMIEQQKLKGIDFPTIFDEVVINLGNAITENDKKNIEEIQKLDAYNLAKQQRASLPVKITTSIRRSNKPYSLSSSSSSSLSSSPATTLPYSQEEPTQEEIDDFFSRTESQVDSQMPVLSYEEEDVPTELYSYSDFAAVAPRSSAISSQKMTLEGQTEMDIMKESIKAAEESEKMKQKSEELDKRIRVELAEQRAIEAKRVTEAKRATEAKRVTEAKRATEAKRVTEAKRAAQREYMFSGPNDPPSVFKTVLHPQSRTLNEFQFNMTPEQREEFIKKLENNIIKLKQTKDPDPLPGYTSTKTIKREREQEEELLERVKGINEASKMPIEDKGPAILQSKKFKPRSDDWDVMPESKSKQYDKNNITMDAGKRHSNKSTNRKTKNSKKYKQTKKKPIIKRSTKKRRKNKKRTTKKQRKKH